MDFSLLKQALDDIVENYNTPGVDCIVHTNHKEVFRYFRGVSDIEYGKPIVGNELYTIFSMTKMLTCTCALQLFEQGKFLMDDPLSKYIGEFETMKIANEIEQIDDGDKISRGSVTSGCSAAQSNRYAQNPITILDLFTMSAGLDYNLWSDSIKSAISEGKTSTRELVGAMAQTVLGFEPGTRFKYSLCHDVLGALIEIWSGLSLGEYMKKNLFEPLGMTNTFFGIPTDCARLERMAQRYEFDSSGNLITLPLEIMHNLSDHYESGGAGLVSSAEDYALFLDALAAYGIGKNGNRILSPSSVELMRTNQLAGKRLDDFQNLRKGYGYGLGVRTHIDEQISGSLSPIGEFGWDGAAGAFSLVDLKNGISMVYFQQVHNWDLEIQTKLRNALYNSIKNNYEGK